MLSVLTCQIVVNNVYCFVSLAMGKIPYEMEKNYFIVIVCYTMIRVIKKSNKPSGYKFFF